MDISTSHESRAWPTSYPEVCSSDGRKVVENPAKIPGQGKMKKPCNPCGYRTFSWSEWRDLNSRPLDPQSSALPTAPHPVTTLFIIQYSKGKCKPFFKKICFFLFSAKDRAKSAAKWFRRGPVFRAAADHQEKWESVFLQGGALCTVAAHGAAYGSSPRRKGERGKEGGRRSSGINYDFAGG